MTFFHSISLPLSSLYHTNTKFMLRSTLEPSSHIQSRFAKSFDCIHIYFFFFCPCNFFFFNFPLSSIFPVHNFNHNQIEKKRRNYYPFAADLIDMKAIICWTYTHSNSTSEWSQLSQEPYYPFELMTFT